MPKKRTKQQKIHARTHYSLPASGAFSLNESRPESVSAKSTSIDMLYTYDPIYLRRDLGRTVILSILILVLQLGLYFWLR